ncbi:MAG: rubredoxin [Lachnospiraceae bacterium]|nr:rubredoxin [Lachnospiraceae bacterium]
MRYVCQICGYIYDDAKEKVPFSDLPDTWTCPLCGAKKSDFKPEEVITPQSPTPLVQPAPVPEEDMKGLSAGQFSALCSNLARGCEKQYKNEEAELFRQLADYFAAITPAVNDATVENIAKLLAEDIENYPSVRATADASADRGAARICVWGEKVTRMLSSLVNRYLDEGERWLAGNNIWVCTVCGFVFVGENPPEICPVCKVPAWKFEKMEGRA